jgi:hypothetical protein
MEDIHYNKYIKYKTKYLELKEQRGSGIGEWFKIKEEKIFENNFDNLKEYKSFINTYLNNEGDISNFIYKLEVFLLDKILPQLYIYNNKTDYQQIIINIYKSFCNTINTYYRSNENIEEILKIHRSQINKGLDKINTSYKIDLPVLRSTISLYFQLLNYCIQQNIQFDKTNKNICMQHLEHLQLILTRGDKKSFSSSDKLLHAVNINTFIS